MAKTQKDRLIILTGPTGVGKTKISIGLAKALNGEIVSADSVQVYRKLNIGSAKITGEEMDGIQHHLIDVLNPEDPFDVTIFQKMASGAILDITHRGKLPIVVGGTGFYIQALRRGVDFTEEEDNKELRTALEKEAERIGKDAFHEKLIRIDPLSYERIPAGNVKRVVRAIEFYQMHGYPISEHNDREKKKESVYDDLCFVLSDHRTSLYERINLRVDQMMEEGLLDEIKSITASGVGEGNTSMQAIGYKEFFPYLNGECSLNEAVEKVKLNTRHFAKRQFTYFKGMDDMIWFDRSDYEDPEKEILKEMIECVKERFQIEEYDKGLSCGDL